MNKLIVTLIAIIVVICAMLTAIMIFNPNNEEKVENIVTELAKEEILDDCTDEYEFIEAESTVKANTQEEKTSPNCSMIVKSYFYDCEHTKSEYNNLPQELVNLTKEEIKSKYPEYEVESFSSNEVVLYQEKQGSCGEHYMVRDKEGQVAIYQILENGEYKELEITDLTTEYLPETDKLNMKNGIKVNGKQALNQLIEDFE